MGNKIGGLIFTYDSGDPIEVTWSRESGSNWITKDIPEGYEIVGFHGIIWFQDNKSWLHCLGFNLWPTDR